MSTDLKSLLTPELFELMVEKWVPFSKTHPLEYGEAISKCFFAPNQDFESLEPKVLAVLKALSLLGLDHIPNLLEFLPPPEDPSFPSQALGLQLVLDQGPRSFLGGIDTRWTYGYFNEIDIEYAKKLKALPAHLNPASWSRWKDSSTLDYFIFVRLWFGAPFVHHEKMAEQAAAFTDETRQLVEQTFKTRDPARDQPERRWDLHGFPKMLQEQGPSSPCGVAQGAFWIALLMDVHKPPLDLYGRYPYQNDRLGRIHTPEEEAWMEKAEIFKIDPEVAKRIRQDVEAGRWTPLGG